VGQEALVAALAVVVVGWALVVEVGPVQVVVMVGGLEVQMPTQKVPQTTRHTPFARRVRSQRPARTWPRGARVGTDT
jgi:hypothetical protein